MWEGHKVIQTSRTMVGHTNPAEAQAGTVRGDFSTHVSRWHDFIWSNYMYRKFQDYIRILWDGFPCILWSCYMWFLCLGGKIIMCVGHLKECGSCQWFTGGGTEGDPAVVSGTGAPELGLLWPGQHLWGVKTLRVERSENQ